MSRVLRPNLVVSLLALLVVAAAITSLTSNSSSGGGAQSGWTIVPTPALANGFLDAVSCSSPTDCVAVGQSRQGYLPSSGRSLIESWHGSEWSVVANPSGFIFDGVSCTSSSFCVAVGQRSGSGTDLTLVESWDGSTWSVVQSPNALNSPNNGLTGVSCTSSTNCEAVGFDAPVAGSDSSAKTLVESWNGNTWSVISSPNRYAGSYAEDFLSAISCVTETTCFAVGSYDIGLGASTSSGTLVQSWNGSTWSTVSAIPDQGDTARILNAVSCSSTTTCTAVGYSENTSTDSDERTLVESWKGSTWSVAPNPSTAVEGALSGVFCVSPTRCTLVGGDSAGTLVETWNGIKGSIVPTPERGFRPLLSAVSCPQTTHCVAVGSYSNATLSKSMTLVEAD